MLAVNRFRISAMPASKMGILENPKRSLGVAICLVWVALRLEFPKTFV